jgi:hypothetical protein
VVDGFMDQVGFQRSRPHPSRVKKYLLPFSGWNMLFQSVPGTSCPPDYPTTNHTNGRVPSLDILTLQSASDPLDKLRTVEFPIMCFPAWLASKTGLVNLL